MIAIGLFVCVAAFTEARAAGVTPVDNLFLHPGALHGVMLGISRSSFAWTWSGCPERVEPA